MTINNSQRVVRFYSDEIKGRLLSFCESTCAGPVRSAAYRGVGFGIEVDRLDVSAVERAADAIKADFEAQRAGWTKILNREPRGDEPAAPALATVLEAIRREHAAKPEVRRALLRRWAVEEAAEAAPRADTSVPKATAAVAKPNGRTRPVNASAAEFACFG